MLSCSRDVFARESNHETKDLMARKKSRRSAGRQATRDRISTPPGHRRRFLVVTIVTALASLALLLAGFLNFSTPPPIVPPAISTPASPSGSNGSAGAAWSVG